MPKNSSGVDVVKFMPIRPDDGKYNQGAMTIQEICAQAAGLQLAISSISTSTLNVSGALTGAAISGTTGTFTTLPLTFGTNHMTWSSLSPTGSIWSPGDICWNNITTASSTSANMGWICVTSAATSSDNATWKVMAVFS